MTELTEKKPGRSGGNGRPIAIIGIACRYAGAQGPDQLWEILRQGRDMVRKVPADRFDVDALYSEEPTPGKLLSREAGFYEHIDKFDAEFFGLSEDAATHLDPQQRLLMMTAWEALEDAGLPPKQIAGSRAGVYVGHMHNDYAARQFQRGLDILTPADVKNYRSMLSAQLSYIFDLRGPSVSVDTACSGSLVSVHLACQSMRAGETTLALACGVNLKILPDEDVLVSQVRMIAPDGGSKFGDASANGFCPSDGVGVIVLKPLDQALADGDRVRAVILGSAVTNDGASSGALLRPSLEGQLQTLRWAYQDAGVSPADVDYVEAHGTGTPMIDPLEFMALGEFIGKGRSKDEPLLVGSIKTNIGHSGGASGLAAMIKAILCLEHRQIPPSLHFRNPNPAIPWDKLSVTVPTRMHAMANRGRPAIVGVSGQGLSCVNAHIVLEEAVSPRDTTPMPDVRPQLFVMSARTDKALYDLARQYQLYLEAPGKGSELHLRDICYSTMVRRQHHECRFAAVIQDRSALIKALARFLKDGAEKRVSLDPEISQSDLCDSLMTLATRYTAGEEVTEWGPAIEKDAHFVPLPTYPWQLASYWL